MVYVSHLITFNRILGCAKHVNDWRFTFLWMLYDCCHTFVMVNESIRKSAFSSLSWLFFFTISYMYAFITLQYSQYSIYISNIHMKTTYFSSLFICYLKLPKLVQIIVTLTLTSLSCSLPGAKHAMSQLNNL